MIHAPVALYDVLDALLEARPKALLVSQDSPNVLVPGNDHRLRQRRRLFQTVHLLLPETREDLVHRRRRHQREPRIGAVGRELVGQCAVEQAAEHTAAAGPRGVALAVRKAPRSEVEGGEIGGVETVTAGECDGVA